MIEHETNTFIWNWQVNLPPDTQNMAGSEMHSYGRPLKWKIIKLLGGFSIVMFDYQRTLPFSKNSKNGAGLHVTMYFIGWVRKQQWPMPNQNQRICLDQNTSCNIIDFDHIPAILTILFNFCIRKSLFFSKNLHLLKVHPKMVGLSNTWRLKKWWATTLTNIDI